jgi:thioredoxin-related protein
VKSFCLVLFIISFFFSACSVGVTTTPIDKHFILDDNSSKIWLVNKLVKNHVDYSNSELGKKDIVIFFATGRCMIQKMNTFGDTIGDKFNYYLRMSTQPKTLELTKEKKKWLFIVRSITDDKIILLPQKGVKFPYEMELIPLPEP